MARFSHVTPTAQPAIRQRYRRNLWMSPWHENAAYLPP
jgi:hypothetical protein